VSRYKLSRSQKFVTVQKFNCEHWREVRVPWLVGSVLVAGAKAKTMTNNLPILSVLAFRYLFFMHRTENPILIGVLMQVHSHICPIYLASQYCLLPIAQIAKKINVCPCPVTWLGNIYLNLGLKSGNNSNL
jgi:hypothetical protein